MIHARRAVGAVQFGIGCASTYETAARCFFPSGMLAHSIYEQESWIPARDDPRPGSPLTLILSAISERAGMYPLYPPT